MKKRTLWQAIRRGITARANLSVLAIAGLMFIGTADFLQARPPLPPPAAISDPFLGAAPTIEGWIENLPKNKTAPVFTHIDEHEDRHAIGDSTSAFSLPDGVRVRFTLKTPPAEWLEPFMLSGVTVTPRDAKGFSFDGFSNAEGAQITYMKDVLRTASFWYVDKDVTINGIYKEGDGGDVKFDLKLKRGWNIVLSDVTATNRSASIVLRSGVPDSNYMWFFSWE